MCLLFVFAFQLDVIEQIRKKLAVLGMFLSGSIEPFI